MTRLTAAQARRVAVTARVAAALAAELRSMADWLGLGEVVVGERGDLVESLRRRL